MLEMRIKRYDRDVLEKTLEANELQKEFETFKLSYDKEQERLSLQDPLYDEMIKDREKTLQERVQHLRYTNAAKVIQKWFKSYLKKKRKKQRKDRKRSKKGKHWF